MFEIGRSWHFKPVSAEVVLTRFGCGIVLHIYLIPEFNSAYANMKYALNHPWKFEKPMLAFLIGLAQALVAVMIESANYILLLTNETQIGVFTGFIAFILVAHFGSVFFQPFAHTVESRIIAKQDTRYANLLKV